MQRRSISPLFVALAAVVACETGTSPQPVAQTPPVDATPAPILTAVRLSPGSALVDPGAALYLSAEVLDQLGNPMLSPYTVTYSSSDSSIADVSWRGAVTAHRAGYVLITVQASLLGTTRTDTARVDVHAAAMPDTADFTFGDHGWESTRDHISANGVVIWRATSSRSSGGSPITWLYLMRPPGYSVVDSVDLRSGVASRRLAGPGDVSFCAGACWDPPDFSLVHVR